MTPQPLPPDPWAGLPADDLRRRAAGTSAQEMVSQLLAENAEDRQVRPWRLGAEGERVAEATLSALPGGWTVLHDVPVGVNGANIDHVVFGPSGIFTVNTKHHKGRHVLVSGGDTWVDGNNYNYVEKALAEADRASNLLSRAMGVAVYVQPVLLFVGVRSLNVEGEPIGGLTVATDRDVRQSLVGRPVMGSSQALEGLVAVAARPETWARRTQGTGPQALKGYGTLAASRSTASPGRVRTLVASTQSWSRVPDSPREQASRQPQKSPHKSRLLRGLAILLVGVALVVFVGSGALTDVSQKVGAWFTQSAAAPEGTQVSEDKRFVTHVRAQFPRLTHGVSDDRLVSLGSSTCATLDKDGQHPRAEVSVLRRVGEVLNHPSKSQAVEFVRATTFQMCPRYAGDVAEWSSARLG